MWPVEGNSDVNPRGRRGACPRSRCIFLCALLFLVGALCGCAGSASPESAPTDDETKSHPPVMIERTDPPPYRHIPQGTYTNEEATTEEPEEATSDSTTSPGSVLPAPELRPSENAENGT